MDGFEDTPRLSEKMTSLLPEFIRDEAPIFEQFIKAYFEYLESEILVIDTQEVLDVVGLEDGMGSVLYEPATIVASADSDSSRIVYEENANNFVPNADPLQIGEYIYGEQTGSLAEILSINGNILYLRSISGNGFLSTERCQGRTSQQRFIVKSYKENVIKANNNLLSYSDIDRTTAELLQYYQKDFLPSLNFNDLQANRLALKNITGFYKQKGSVESLKYLIRLLYGDDAEVSYPIQTTAFASDSDYSQRRRMSIEMQRDGEVPSPTDKITQFDNFGAISAQSVIESVSLISGNVYSIDISPVLTSDFIINREVKLQDRDGQTEFLADVRGSIVGVAEGASSTYLSEEDNTDVFLYEDGSGILLEQESIGSLYRINDKINFSGAKDNSDVIPSEGVVSGLTKGPVESILIEDGGTGYFGSFYLGIEIAVENSQTIAVNDPLEETVQPGLRVFGTKLSADIRITSVASDRLSFQVSQPLTLNVGEAIQIGTPQIVVFDNDGTGGQGAEGLIGSVGDQIIQENAPDVFGQYEFTAEPGQTIFSGRDNYGNPLVFNDATVQVFVDEILRTEDDSTYGYVQKNDRITFNIPMLGGETIDIYNQFNYLTFEDGSYMNLENDVIILSGTLDFVSGSNVINGTNTKFQDEIRAGDDLTDSNDVVYQVQSVIDQTTLEIVGNATVTQTETNVRRTREDGTIRSIILPDGGYEYQQVPRVFPGGYIYFSDVSDIDDFQDNEVLTGLTSSAQCTVLRKEKDRRRIVVKREPSQTGEFIFGEVIEGNVGSAQKIPSSFQVASGSGARLFAWSSQIGGVAEVNLQSQGAFFNSDGILDSSSTYTMLITTPTSALNKDTIITGRISGATGKVISYDADRHILYYTELDGCFLYNEYVDYGLVDDFRILVSDMFNARGASGDLSIVERQLLGDRGTTSSIGSNIQDSRFYQTHSYVIRTAQSINIYRSIIKDLVHPAGHIFFGEVSIQNQISDTRINTKFEPTIIIFGTPVLAVPDAFSNSIRIFEIFTKSNGLITEDGDPVILESGGQIAVTLDDQMNFINDPLTVLRDANEPKGPEGKRTGPDVDPRTGGSILPYETVDGVQIGRGTEYYDSGMRNQHVNVRIISTFASAAQRTRLANRYTNVDPNTLEYVSQKPYVSLTGDVQEGDFPVPTHYGFSDPGSPTERDFGGGLTALSLDMPNTEVDGEPISPNGSQTKYGGVDGYFIPEKRKLVTQGKIFSYSVKEEEKLVYEDGSTIIREIDPERMRTEPRIKAEVRGDFGDYLIFEDDEYIELEEGTITHEDHFFVTERSYQASGGHNFYTEDNYSIVTENDEYLVQEHGSENTSMISYVPFGSTLRSLNRIAGQRIYTISYYIKNEDNDDIILEDGIGNILSEDSVSEGLQINQIQQAYDWYITEFPLHERKRSSLAYSAYVTSAQA